MIIIQHNNGVVVDIFNCRNDATNNNISVETSIPEYIPKDGYNGILKYNEHGLYWDYEVVQESNDITSDEFQAMIEEVL